MTLIVEADSHGAMVLPASPCKRYLMTENADGSILLQPVLMSEAQAEYDGNAELRQLLTQATSAPTVRRQRR